MRKRVAQRYTINTEFIGAKNMLTLKSTPQFPYMYYSDEMSEEMSIFQSAEMQRCFFTNSLVYAVPKHMSPCTISVLDDNTPVLIFPLLANDSKAELAGHANGICELSPIYFKSSEKKLKQYLKFFLETSNYSEYSLTRIRESTQLCCILNEGIAGYDISAMYRDNVSIDFSCGYDSWFQSLSKSTRQNLRTAYNRLEKDCKSVRVEVSNGRHLTHSLMNKLLDIYIKRHDERYKVKTSALKSVYLRYLDFSTRALLNNPRAFHVYIFISDRVASFCSGYLDNDVFIVPRLSIDNDFARYSPGYLLINEAIKWFSLNSNIHTIDLSEGAEKYKLDLGGTVYKKVDYTIKRTKN